MGEVLGATQIRKKIKIEPKENRNRSISGSPWTKISWLLPMCPKGQGAAAGRAELKYLYADSLEIRERFIVVEGRPSGIIAIAWRYKDDHPWDCQKFCVSSRLLND